GGPVGGVEVNHRALPSPAGRGWGWGSEAGRSRVGAGAEHPHPTLPLKGEGNEALPLEGVGVSDWPTPNPSRRREGDRGSTSRRAWQGQPGAALRRVRADAGEEARVGVEQAVPALRLVRRVDHVGEVAVAEAGAGVGGAGFAGPGPEVEGHDRGSVKAR